tara:strand:- start:53273 stop:53923 length:651 start_codon:yes stop_codon:yes gene_type:complete
MASDNNKTLDEIAKRDAPVNLVWHKSACDSDLRATLKRQNPACIWLTGLSASGKSTLANALEVSLAERGFHTYLLDGDNVRQGLNKDLGMSDSDRAENIRRVGEVARLMTDAGLIIITAFISPFRDDRDKARALFSANNFIEVFVDTPLAVCEQRDPKGLYKKARAGEIKDFTGIDSAYEAPKHPELHLHAGDKSIEQCVKEIVQVLTSVISHGQD